MRSLDGLEFRESFVMCLKVKIVIFRMPDGDFATFCALDNTHFNK